MMEILVKELLPEVSQRKEERIWTISRGKSHQQIEVDDIKNFYKEAYYKFICLEVIGYKWIKKKYIHVYKFASF